MKGNQITKHELKEKLPVLLREQLKIDNLPRNHLPSWTYISKNTRYSAEGLNINTQGYFDKTLHEFLKSQGFGINSTGKWSTDNEEMVKSLEYYLDTLEKNLEWSDKTISSVKSILAKSLEAIAEKEIDLELIEIGRYETEEQKLEHIQLAKQIIKYMKNQLTPNAFKNYLYYTEHYFEVVRNRFIIDFNPISRAGTEFDAELVYTECYRLDSDQIQRIWNVLDNLEECPYDRYDLNEWKLQMKVLILFLLGVGPRSHEITEINIHDQIILDDNPRVIFHDRKNIHPVDDPVKVPIMFNSNVLEAYINYRAACDDDSNKLIPSPQSKSGSRDAGTLNSWIKELCKKANVTLENGEYPTIYNFRKTWKSEYKIGVHKNRKQLEIVGREDGKTADSDGDDYIPDEEQIQQIRELCRNHFSDLLYVEQMPTLLQDVEENSDIFFGTQARLGDF